MINSFTFFLSLFSIMITILSMYAVKIIRHNIKKKLLRDNDD